MFKQQICFPQERASIRALALQKTFDEDAPEMRIGLGFIKIRLDENVVK
jgi:hypothetical protein